MASRASSLDRLIDKHLADLAKPGVLSVRPGYEMTGGWLTGRRAVVVTVRRKVKSPPPGDMLPDRLGTVPVDVRQASTRKREELLRPATYARKLRLAPDRGSVPHFPTERTLTGERPAAAASAHAQLAKIPKPNLPYSGPPGAKLKPVTKQMTITLSASPDAGWGVLSGFLASTTHTLTVGLYDLTSAHVLAALRKAMKGRALKLVLDHPPTNPTADQTDAATVASLRRSLKTKLTQAWALSRTDRDATAWIYPTAYHIKVAVRDRSTMWLSSGNWNNSNQPDIKPATVAADATTARHRDRDWHVVIDEPTLAALFEDYLLHDLDTAAAHNAGPETPGAPLPAPPLSGTKTPAFHEFFAPTTITGRIKVSPLLTPDPGVYVDAVKALIAGATTTLYMQFQYIEMPRAGAADAQPFLDLITAVIERQRAGVDVRVIMSEFETAGYLEQLQAAGLDVVNSVKLQNNVHNKGIVVDGKAVLVSSQNWSTDGTLFNRDAGVIIYNQQAAQYFQQIFLHDWTHLAHTKAASD